VGKSIQTAGYNGARMVDNLKNDSALGLSSPRIESYQHAQACPWKFHNVAYATLYLQITLL
jgi:hypothetical protein